MHPVAFSTKNLDGFHKAATSLKLFSRAELSDEKDRTLIEKLYVDPLPNEQVFKTLLANTTTIIVGRKGTGKSTVFQRVQHEIRKNKSNTISAYMDIRNVYEASQVDPILVEKIGALEGTMSSEQIAKFLLYKRFFKTLLQDIRNELKTQVELNFLSRLKQNLIGGATEAFKGLDGIINRLDSPNYEDIAGYVKSQIKEGSESKRGFSASMGASAKAGALAPSFAVNASGEVTNAIIENNEEAYSQLLLRIIGVSDVIEELKNVLKYIDLKNLFIFLDDFSELPHDAMHLVVDSLISPLSRWSEFVKFKIAAYPGRIYLGSIDKTKIEEVNLDIFGLYGGSGVVQMEEKATDFVRRLVTRRLDHFCKNNSEIFFDSKSDELWRIMFYASMANPRTLGHVLLYSYESSLIYGRNIGLRTIQDGAERFFDEKVLPFFSTGRFRVAFKERSSVYSLKELLEKVVSRARHIRQEGSRSGGSETASVFASHFYVSREYEDLFQSLELSFFMTKYFEQSDREGQRVSIFALNYGLCVKYQIGFGRPAEKRSDRLYFVSRKFDYNGIIRNYINENQEIRCDSCGAEFEPDILPALKLTQMKCLTCKSGTCQVVNLSKKYEDLIDSVSPDLLLPDTELGILQALKVEDRAMFAAEIAGELDCSGQLVGRRGKNLAERDLVTRTTSGQVFSYSLSKDAAAAYFPKDRVGELILDDDEKS